MGATNRQIELQWSEFRDSIKNSTPVDLNETPDQQRKRITKLEKDFEAWVKYYFPKYASSEPADFHKKASRRILNNLEWFECRSWSRELAKSTRTMFEVLFLILTKKKRYVLLVSNNETNASNLLEPYRSQLDTNRRIMHDYGIQETLGKWTYGEFTTRSKVAFKAIGAGQSPRGTRNEEVRPDVILGDDIDTDEDCRNPEIIQKKWDWIESALLPTRSISMATTIIFNGNIIAKDCCIVRAQEIADHTDIVNIRDEEGKSTWPQKNSEADIDRVLSQKSYAAQQREYYNNPIEQGTVIKEVVYGKCPKLKELQFAVVYADPSPSNKDRPTLRAKVQNSCKAVVVLGYLNNKYYVYKAFVDTTTNSTFIDWLYATKNYVGNATQLYTFIENNSLQDPFYEQVLLPLIFEKGKENGGVLGVTPDGRDKPDKYFRIEGTLEPLFRLGLLVFNIDEKEDPHMKRLETQCKSVSANSKTMDGPDALEGGIFILKEKTALASVDDIKTQKRNRSTSKSF